MRSTLTQLRDLYPPPTYEFEPTFAEADPYWFPDERESIEHRVARARSVLDVAFAQDVTCGYQEPFHVHRSHHHSHEDSHMNLIYAIWNSLA